MFHEEQNNFTNASLYGPPWLLEWREALDAEEGNQNSKSTEVLLQLFTDFVDKYGGTYGMDHNDFTMMDMVRWCSYEGENCTIK